MPSARGLTMSNCTPRMDTWSNNSYAMASTKGQTNMAARSKTSAGFNSM
jgi:hypothetical protein